MNAACRQILVLFLLCCAGQAGVARQASIVVGSFSTPESAQSGRRQLEIQLSEPLDIQPVFANGATYHRVMTRAMEDGSEARRRLQVIRQAFASDAWLLITNTSTIPPADEASTPQQLALVRGTQVQTADERYSRETESSAEEFRELEELGDDLFGPVEEFDVQPTLGSTDDWWSISGQLAVLGSYSYDLDADGNPLLEPYGGLSKLQTLLRLRADLYYRQWKLHLEAKGFYDWVYDIQGAALFTDEVKASQQAESEWHEVYLQGDLMDSLNIKIGRQILSWGRSDNLRILDVLNPLDLREPGSADIEDLRLPVNMTRLRYVRGAWTLELAAIHEVRFNKLPVYGSEFLPILVPAIPESRPSSGFAAEHAISLTGVFSGWDVSVHHALTYDDDVYLNRFLPTSPRLEHARLRMSGLAFNRTIGSWLFKGEYAIVGDYRSSISATDRFKRSDLMMGVEYGGWVNTQFAVETSRQHLHDWRGSLLLEGRPEDRWQSAVRLSRSYLNERLTLMLVALFQGEHLDEGHIVRGMIEFKPVDDLTTSIGVVIYGDGDSPPLSNLGDRDRMSFLIKYHF